MKIKTTTTPIDGVFKGEPISFDFGPMECDFRRVIMANKKVTVEKHDGTILVYEAVQ